LGKIRNGSKDGELGYSEIGNQWLGEGRLNSELEGVDLKWNGLQSRRKKVGGGKGFFVKGMNSHEKEKSLKLRKKLFRWRGREGIKMITGWSVLKTEKCIAGAGGSGGGRDKPKGGSFRKEGRRMLGGGPS